MGADGFVVWVYVKDYGVMVTMVMLDWSIMFIILDNQVCCHCLYCSCEAWFSGVLQKPIDFESCRVRLQALVICFTRVSSVGVSTRGVTLQRTDMTKPKQGFRISQANQMSRVIEQN
jgi:hypothetical protein